MKEVKPSKKPLAIYYAIVLLVLLVLQLVLQELQEPLRRFLPFLLGTLDRLL